MQFKTHFHNCIEILRQILANPKKTFPIILNAIKSSTFFWGPVENDIGVSIGHKNIIVVELDKTHQAPKIIKFSVREVPEESRSVSDVLQTIFMEDGFSSTKVNAAINGKSIIVRFIKFPRMNNKELRSALEYEAEKYIPFDVSQVYLDFNILRNDDSKKYLEVVLVAAKKEGVHEVLECCHAAGLTVKIMDTDAFACLNTFLTVYPDEKMKINALINMGAKVTNIIIIENGIPAFTRDIYFGGDDITEGISKRLHIDLDKARQIKYNLKGQDESAVKAVREVLSYLLTEIKLSFDYFETQNKKERNAVEAIYMIGGSSQLEGLVDLFAMTFDIKVDLFDPLRSVLVDENVDGELLQKYAASLAVPIGLALRK